MLLIRNGFVHPITAPAFMGDVLLDQGRILSLGQGLCAPDAQQVDATGCFVLPGLVDAHCHIGLCADGTGEEDINEGSDPVTPELRAIDAIDPFDPCFEEARRAGITTVVTGPGSANVIGGQFAAMKTKGGPLEDALLKAPSAMKAALGENPKNAYQENQEKPYTRMAIAALLRQSLTDAQTYANKRARKDSDEELDLGKEALNQVLKGELMLKVHAHRADDILTALRIAREFHLNISLDHCTEGHKIAPYLAQEIEKLHAHVILGPLISDRSKVELRNLTMTAPKILHEAGIPFALMSDYPCIPVQYLPVCAALAVREGLPENVALEAITINAARANGIDSRVGSLELGKDADVAVFSGNPLEFRTRCLMTVIDGAIVHRETI